MRTNTNKSRGCDTPASVVFDKARFQVLTSRIVRMEWAEDGRFEDRDTLAVERTGLPWADFTKSVQGRRLELSTPHFKLEYAGNGRPFSPRNLKVSFTLNGRTQHWHPGKKDRRNLRGTARTLDNADGKTRLSDGLLSRSGWALVDDSQGVVLDSPPNGEGRAAARPPGKRYDWYLLLHGHDYRGALREAAPIFGAQPLPPRFALGYWWSRYWAYTDLELEDLVRQFDSQRVPLDVLVVDMDWHLEGWTGYSWDRRYFPDPREFLNWVHARGVKVTLNLHPAEGVGRHEEAFERMCKALGKESSAVRRIPFDCCDPVFMEQYFKQLHHPLEEMGVDFWWMDWQQGTQSKLPGLDPLPWLNRLHWEDALRRRPNRRPLSFSRYGGLGSGRYPVGFSGDTNSTWASLAFQPYFTASAANVLYGYWSHDIGGHQPGVIEPELYTRWVQYGVFSPVLRTHTTKNAAAERRFWEYPAPYSEIMMDAVRRRYELVPYIYGENRKCLKSGVPLCHPLYYDYPEAEEAYQFTHEYMFGDRMLAAPVTEPADRKDEMAPTEVWLPPGTWFDTALGAPLEGGRVFEGRYLIEEVPVFVKEGAVIPGQAAAMRLNQRSYSALILTIYPGPSGEGVLYEDDGLSRDYLQGGYATTFIRHETRGALRTVVIEPSQGAYRGFAKEKSLELRLPGCLPPSAVTVNNKSYRWSFRAARESWRYDGASATVLVQIPRIDLAKKNIIRIKLPFERGASEKISGMQGLMHRMRRVLCYSTMATGTRITHKKERLPAQIAQTGNRISRRPRAAADELKQLGKCLKEMPAFLRAMEKAVGDKAKKEAIRRAAAIYASTMKQEPFRHFFS
jgi:hypothetical protein